MCGYIDPDRNTNNTETWSIGLPVSLLLAGLLEYQERLLLIRCYKMLP